jgi:hypothetical protein
MVSYGSESLLGENHGSEQITALKHLNARHITP